RESWAVGKSGEIMMQYLGVFGVMVADSGRTRAELEGVNAGARDGLGRGFGGGGGAYQRAASLRSETLAAAMPSAAAPGALGDNALSLDGAAKSGGAPTTQPAEAFGGPAGGSVEPTVRTNFADTA